jgi:hypothetical protein
MAFAGEQARLRVCKAILYKLLNMWAAHGLRSLDAQLRGRGPCSQATCHMDVSHTYASCTNELSVALLERQHVEPSAPHVPRVKHIGQMQPPTHIQDLGQVPASACMYAYMCVYMYRLLHVRCTARHACTVCLKMHAVMPPT